MTARPRVEIPSHLDGVVAILRRDVPPPHDLPIVARTIATRTYRACPRFVRPMAQPPGHPPENEECCPLGLHPRSNHPAPWDEWRAPAFSPVGIANFVRWWDSLTIAEAREATLVIWPLT